VDEVGALFGEVVEGPVLPVALRCLQAEEGDRDLPLEGAGGVVVEEVPVADDAVPAVFEERRIGDVVSLFGIDCSGDAICSSIISESTKQAYL